ncbi:hypothetical protein [Halobacillus mangrovi]|uniref:hypothetical protein n=1 Tax=Halobacillus mangrovi TaxID=402384 RepID=UPI003D990724
MGKKKEAVTYPLINSSYIPKAVFKAIGINLISHPFRIKSSLKYFVFLTACILKRFRPSISDSYEFVNSTHLTF